MTCNLGFEVGAGFVFCFVVLSVDFVSCFGQGCFYELGGGGQVLIFPDVSLAYLAGEGLYILSELVSQSDLCIVKRRNFTGVTFSGHFYHNQMRQQVNNKKGCCKYR